MQTIERTYTVKKIMENIENGNIVFNHPMQRKPDQWDSGQKGLLIHSILGGYAISQTYVLQLFDNDFDSFSVLDGKQRYTTIYDFMNDGFRLSKDTPSVAIKKKKVITDENGNRHTENVSEEYEIADKYYSELDEKLKEKIRDHEFSVIMLADCTDEEIEDQFYRLNNGTALTQDQKTRVVLGDELAEFVDRQESNELFARKSYFSANKRKQGDVQTCILQTIMLIMDFPYDNFNCASVMKFAEWFRANHKNSDLEYCEDIFNKLNMAIPPADKPNKLMKKTNIPILAYHIQTADEIGLSIEQYGKWINDFFESYSPEGEYASYCGQASTSKAKVTARLDYVSREIRKLVK